MRLDLRGKRVLVTGGAGFIGSHVVEALLDRGCSVVVLDNFSTGKLSNLGRYLDDSRLTIIKGDVRDLGAVERALEGARAVVHEAAVKSVPLSFKNPAFTHEVNVGGTLNLLRAASEAGVERFVFASSAAVYGEQDAIPIGEDAPPNPLSPYGHSKLLGERECLNFWKDGKIETVCLRYFNVYGPRMTGDEYAGVMTRFAERLRADQPPIIYGDGEQTRDFVHVADATDATVRALEREGIAGEVINVGSGRATSINELCEIFLEAAGKPHLRPVHEPPRSGDIRRSQADIAKGRRLLGYEPAVALERGIKDLLGFLGLA